MLDQEEITWLLSNILVFKQYKEFWLHCIFYESLRKPCELHKFPNLAQFA